MAKQHESSLNRDPQAMEAARTFRPMDKTRVSALPSTLRAAALTEKYEHLKTVAESDSTASNPEWMG
jgi:hypothetical protein